MNLKTIALGLAIPLLGLAAAPTQACTRILWNNNDLAVVVSRTMDWPKSTEPILTVFPRGLKHNGGYIGPVQIVKDNPAIWTSAASALLSTASARPTA